MRKLITGKVPVNSTQVLYFAVVATCASLSPASAQITKKLVSGTCSLVL
jgi:hypothetical protein